MGVYTANRISSFGGIDPETIVANENYSGAGAAELILIENYQNDMAMFEAILANDFAEAVAVNEGTVLESELMAITEGAVGDFFNKVKEALKKVWEKIKGIFKAFMAKLSGVLIRDNKKFVEKYKSEVLKKDLSKMKFKYSKPSHSASEIALVKADEGSVSTTIDAVYRSTKVEDVNAYMDNNVRDDKLLEEALAATIGATSGISLSEYAKEAHEWFFEDEEEMEGLDSGVLNRVMSILIDTKSLKEAQETQKKIDKSFSKHLTELDKRQNKILKDMPDEDGKKTAGLQYARGTADSNEASANKTTKTNVIACMNAHREILQVYQSVMTKATTAAIDAIKFDIKQCRAIFAKAAAFNPKSVKEDALLIQAVGEAAEYEVESILL